MSNSESEILEVLNGLGSKKLDLDILFSYYSLELSFEIRKVIAEKIGMQERKGYFLLEKMIKKFGLKVEFIKALKLTNEKNAKDLLLKNLYQNNKLNIHIINALEPWGGEIELQLIREIFDICETDFWIAGLNILHFKAHQLTDEKLLSFIEILLSKIMLIFSLPIFLGLNFLIVCLAALFPRSVACLISDK